MPHTSTVWGGGSCGPDFKCSKDMLGRAISCWSASCFSCTAITLTRNCMWGHCMGQSLLSTAAWRAG